MWLRASLGVLCALTLVVVGSALYRMHLYQEAYGFTQLRLLVDVFEGWLGLLVLAVAVAGLVRWGVWLPRFALVSGVVALLGVAAINPDAWIAERNLDRYADTGRVDWHFLRNLSADAVPVFGTVRRPRSRAGCRATGPRTTTGSPGTSAGAGPSAAIDDGPDAMAAALATAQPTADDLTAADCPERVDALTPLDRRRTVGQSTPFARSTLGRFLDSSPCPDRTPTSTPWR